MGKVVMTLAEFIQKLEAIEPDSNGCKIWPGHINKANGYAGVMIDEVLVGAHRLALEHRLGRPIKPGLLACHTCDVKACVEPWHLYEGTHKQNADDAVNRGQQASGERHGSSKLTWTQVDQIRALEGIKKGSEVARQFGVAPIKISKIWRGQRWDPAKRPKIK
jgi:hypothetical protein